MGWRSRLAVLLLTLAACTPRVSGTADVSRARPAADAGNAAPATTTRAPSGTLPAGFERAWSETLRMYASLGFTSGRRDPEAGTMTFGGRWEGGELAGRSLGAYVRCGSDLTGTDVASVSEVELTVTTRLRPVDEATTEMTTEVQAMSLTGSGGRGSLRRCASTGALEGDFFSGVRDFVELTGADPPTGGAADAEPRAPANIRRAVTALERGQQVRLALPWRTVTGPVLDPRPDVLEIREGVRQRRIPTVAIQELFVREEGSSLALPFGIAGAVVGGVVFAAADVGIGGEQGKKLNPVLGAVAGSLVGAGIGALFGGSTWVSVARLGGR